MDVTLANTSSHYFQPRNENRENDPYPPKVAGFPKKSARNFRKGNSSAGYVLPVNRTPFYFNAQEDPAHIYEAVI